MGGLPWSALASALGEVWAAITCVAAHYLCSILGLCGQRWLAFPCCRMYSVAAVAVWIEKRRDAAAPYARASVKSARCRVYSEAWIVHDAGLRREVELSIDSSAWFVVIREQQMMQLRVEHLGR